MKHLPLHTEETKSGIIIKSQQKSVRGGFQTIAYVQKFRAGRLDEQRKYAEFIKRACNSHYDLVAFLESNLKIKQRIYDQHPEDGVVHKELGPVIQELCDLLTKATKEEYLGTV